MLHVNVESRVAGILLHVAPGVICPVVGAAQLHTLLTEGIVFRFAKRFAIALLAFHAGTLVAAADAARLMRLQVR